MTISEARRKARREQARQKWLKNNPKKRAEAIKRYQQKNWKKHLQWAKDNRGIATRHSKKWYLREHYGLTLEQWDKMFFDQGGKCAVCKDRKARDVDHCHKTGKVRALLCNPCNQALGAMRDSPKILRDAANYLEKYEQKN